MASTKKTSGRKGWVERDKIKSELERGKMAKESDIWKILFSWKMLLFWIIIVITVFLAHYFSGFLEKMVINGNSFAWVLLFLWYLLWIAVIGTIFAYIFMRKK